MQTLYRRLKVYSAHCVCTFMAKLTEWSIENSHVADLCELIDWFIYQNWKVQSKHDFLLNVCVRMDFMRVVCAAEKTSSRTDIYYNHKNEYLRRNTSY